MKRNLTVLLALLLAAATISGCPGSKKTTGGAQGDPNVANARVESSPLAELSSGAAQEFVRLSNEETGITFANKVFFEDLNVDRLTSFAGLTTADFNGDGKLDVYICGLQEPNRLYQNQGNWKFTDVTASAGDGLDVKDFFCCGATAFDLEGDGDQDLYVSVRNGRNRLFVNDGQGRFTDEAAARGVDSDYSTVCAAVFDADNDGDLDMYLGNYRDPTRNEVMKQITAEPDRPVKEILMSSGTGDDIIVGVDGNFRFQAEPDQLFINDGSGKFTDESEKRGITELRHTLNALACDFNDDGFQDLHISCDFENNDLYLINDGKGGFTDQAADMLRKTAFFSMGSDAGDVNNDGLMDLFVVDMAARDYETQRKLSGDMNDWRYFLINDRPQQQMFNHLYINRGDGWMTEIAEFAGVKNSDWGWTAKILDLDSDGSMDLLATNGFISRGSEYDIIKETMQNLEAGFTHRQMFEFKKSIPEYRTEDVIWVQDKPLSFKEAPNNMGLKSMSIGCGATLQDFDGDGDMDIIINTTNDPAEIWRNDATKGNRAVISLRQEGTPNLYAVGARVWAHCGEDIYTQEVILNRGMATGETADIYLGLGAHETIDSLEVRWPGGDHQVFKNLAANMRHTVYKSSGLPKWQKPTANPMFAEQRLGWEQMERDTVEMEFDNNKQPLLPVQRSNMGTGMGVADYNGDGKLDIYFGGATGQEGRIYLGGEKFEMGTATAGMNVKEAEEMGILWIDVDGDKRLDLLITNGGMENNPGDAAYQDLLLLNKESGFQKVALPDGNRSTGAVCAADIDHDGSLEILLAGHLVQHAFAKAERSSILSIDANGKATDATAKFAPQLGTPGPVNDAQFADVNGDGWQDLLLACEWSGVKLALNNNGVLAAPQDVCAKGMWQSLGVGDFDNDGDLDVMAGNWGWNTKYHPKDGAPMTMFADDFDKNGIRDLIEVKYGKDCMLPGRGRSCSGYAISYIPEKWPTWEDFANAKFEEVYGDPAKIAERYDAEQLRSVLLVNNGSGSFETKELPIMSQWSAVYGIGVGDYNNDGNLDALLGQNFYSPQPETSRWTSGFGQLILGDGKGGFTELEPTESGVWIFTDARGVIPADFNGDGLLDVAVSISNLPEPIVNTREGAQMGQVMGWEGHGRGNPRILMARPEAPRAGSGINVSVSGKGRNTQAVGTRLTLELSSGTKLTRIVQAGSGYMSSYSGPLHFGIPEGATPVRLTAQWPDGTSGEITAFEGNSASIAWQ